MGRWLNLKERERNLRRKEVKEWWEEFDKELNNYKKENNCNINDSYVDIYKKDL